MRRRALLVSSIAAVPIGIGRARSAPVVRVAYAGSMGVVMDRALGPSFTAAKGASYQGIGQGAFALARLIAGHQLAADVFVSVTPGPVRVLQRAGLAGEAVPVASTDMVIAYAPKSRFGPQMEAAAKGQAKWYDVLRAQGLRFGRTDPLTDPQGRNIVFTIMLAERFYDVPGLTKAVLGPLVNPAQIFTEPSLLSRLEGGQIDASSAYRSAAVSHQLPFVSLPPEINLRDPSLDAAWYSKVSLSLPNPGGGTQVVRPEPLVFYAVVPTDAPNPALGREFVAYLTTAEGQKAFRDHGYGPPKGGALAGG